MSNFIIVGDFKTDFYIKSPKCHSGGFSQTMAHTEWEKIQSHQKLEIPILNICITETFFKNDLSNILETAPFPLLQNQ